ncbi:hypothetical protein PQX77_007023 [Marasmius sp. AFHP31]|nr:hypothetical protein PQX77_007023 [Marasmius sp. AFHP31]
MQDTSIATKHSPAVKVGGRRLSTTTRPKPHTESRDAGPASLNASEDSKAATTEVVDDYPRPVARSDNSRDEDNHNHNFEDESLRREMKRHAPSRIVHDTQPTRDYQTSSKGPGYGAGGRIAQPSAGRVGV